MSKSNNMNSETSKDIEISNTDNDFLYQTIHNVN